MTITLRRVRHPDSLDDLIEVQGSVSCLEVYQTAKADPLGRVHIAAVQRPDASLGDSLRLLAFYCDVKAGRR